MDRLFKFWSLTRSEKLCLWEAGALLMLSALCVRTIAFKHIDRFLRARWNDVPRSDSDRADPIGLVEQSVSRAARLMPWNSQCLSRSISAYVMLRRRGIPAVLYAGVKVSADSSLHAHAWVALTHGTAGANAQDDRYTTLLRIGQEAVER